MLLISMTCIMAQAVSDYTFSTVTNGSLEDMSTDTTTLLTGYSDSGATAVTDIGFSFTFAGTAYTQFSANANGLVRLGGTVISGYSTSPVASAAILGTFSGDNCIASTGKIHYKLIGAVAPRKLVIEFKELRLPYAGTPGAGTPSTVQVWLTETSNIVNYVYGAMYNNSTSSLGRGVFISSNTTTGNIGSVATIVTTPSWVTTGTSVVTSSFAASSYMTNLNSTADGSRRVFTFLPPDPFAVPNPAIVGYPLNGSWAFTDATLSWASGGGVPTSYDVYFGTSTTPPLVSDDQTGLTYTPTLAANTTYYWQIVPRNDNGEAENCPVWSFKTPTATQLAESFESTTFPPSGWANPNSWSRGTSYKFHGTAGAYKSGSTTASYVLSGPKVTITSTSTLDFWAAGSSTTTAILQVIYSPDRVNWTQIGSDITYAATYTFYHQVIDLASLAGNNYYIGFRNGAGASTNYIDHVFGPEITAEAPGPVTQTLPADLATGVSNRPTFTWTAPTTGGVPTGYRVYCDTNTDPTTQIADVATLTYYATTALNYSTLYYWKVVAYNGTGDSIGNTTFSFTTMADPTITTLPWSEDFGTTGTTFPPANWTYFTGLLAPDPVTLTPATTGGLALWSQDNWGNDTSVTPVDWAARLNIYSTTRNHWQITPPIQLPGTGYQLEFDIALTDYSSTSPITSDPNGTTGIDDKFTVLIGNGNTWTTANILRQWDNAGSPYVYNDVPNTGMHVTLPLDSYNGIYYIAFYGESTLTNADNDFFVDNVLIRQTPVGAPEHVTLTSPVDGATGLWPENLTLSWTASMTGGTPAYYEVYVGENPIDPGTSYYGEYMYETTNTSLNLSAQDDINLGYSTTWYWAVLPYNSGGLSPDPDTPDFNVWDFTIISDPTITSLPREEHFDSVTAPALPYGWTKKLVDTSDYGVVETYRSTSHTPSNSVKLYNSSDIVSDKILISPQIDPALSLTTIRVRFWLYGPSTGGIQVGTVDVAGSSAVFTNVQTVIPASASTWAQYIVSFAGYEGPNKYIAFKHALGATYQTWYIDDVAFEEIPTSPIFVYTPTSINFGTANSNIPTAYQNVTVTNNGVGTLNLLTSDISLIGTDPTQFGFTTTTGFPAALTSGQSVNIPVRFNPASTGDKSATLRITYNSTNYDVALTGTALGEFVLNESFEGATFPPAGWSYDPTWYSSSSYAYQGSKSCYRSTTATATKLITPTLAVTPTTVLNFKTYVVSSTYQKIQLSYYDGTTWNPFGTEISLTPAAWQNHSITLTGLTGNYKIGIGAYYGTGGSGASVYVDMVWGPVKANLVPDPVTQNLPADLAVNQAIRPNLTWTPNTTGIGGTPTGYKIYLDSSETPITPTTLIYTDDASPYTLTTALNYGTKYYWMVVATNSAGDAINSPVRCFTTMADPTVLSINEYFGTTGTTFPPTNWTRYSGQLLDPSTLTTTTSGWTSDDWGNLVTTPVNYSARMEIWSTNKYWLLTPPIQMPGAGFQLDLDIALTYYSSTAAPTTTQPDDRFIILIGDGNSWSPANILREWNNSGSAYVFNDIPTTGVHVSIPLDAYTGIKYIAFYGESTVSGNGDNNLYVDNVKVWTPTSNDLAATGITGPGAAVVGTPVTHTVSITNNGTADQTGFTVYLKSVSPAATIDSYVMPLLAAGASTTHAFTWTPPISGSGNIYGEVYLSTDTVPGNNTTPNLPITIYPEGTWIEGFEAGYIPSDWTLRTGDTGSYNWEIYSTNPRTGTKCVAVRWESSTLANNDWLITPPIQLSATAEDNISFWLGKFSTSYSEEWEVLISTTTNQIADFTLIDSGAMASAFSGYEQKSYNLDAYGGAVVYIAVRYIGLNKLRFYADDFMGPALYVPAEPVVTVETVPTGIKLSWAANPYAKHYKIYADDDPYGLFNGAPITTTSNEYIITAPAAKKFYKVVASTSALPSKAAEGPSFIEPPSFEELEKLNRK